MSTNYYLHTKPCPHCGRDDEPLHIGCFALHVWNDPTEGPTTLEEWEQLWAQADRFIVDELGIHVPPDLMKQVIAERQYSKPLDKHWLGLNNATLGPNGLARRKRSAFCIGHGEGPWDLCVGDFS